MKAAIHFGPHVDSVGGTQSVIRTIAECAIGADQIRVVPTWAGSDHVHNARLTARAARVITRADDEGVVLHFHVSRGGAWLREGGLILLAGVRGLPIAATLHGDDLPSFVAARPSFVRRVLQPVDQLICLSEAARAAIAAVAPDAAIHVVPNPVEVAEDAPGADETAPVALFAGAINMRKGVDVLVDAWRKVLSRGIDGECWIVGPPDDYTPPRMDRLEVRGPVHPREVGALIREARVVVLPSRSEGMPMILTEALAARRPFVATDVGGIRHITPDPQMIVPVGDANALADALARYLGDADLAARAGDRGQRHIMATRSPEVVDRQLRDIYGRI